MIVRPKKSRGAKLELGLRCTDDFRTKSRIFQGYVLSKTK